jgi:hypothetical protein
VRPWETRPEKEEELLQREASAVVPNVCSTPEYPALPKCAPRTLTDTQPVDGVLLLPRVPLISGASTETATVMLPVLDAMPRVRTERSVPRADAAV